MDEQQRLVDENDRSMVEDVESGPAAAAEAPQSAGDEPRPAEAAAGGDAPPVAVDEAPALTVEEPAAGELSEAETPPSEMQAAMAEGGAQAEPAVDASTAEVEPEVAQPQATVASVEEESQSEPAADASRAEVEPEAAQPQATVAEVEDETEDEAAESGEEAAADEPDEPVVDIRAILRQAREAAAAPEQSEEQPPAETAAPPAEVADERAWFVIHCYSGYEKKVKHNLEQRIETMGMADQIFQVVVPTEEEIEVREGKRRTVERRVFPGYILVQMAMNDDSWYVVRNTPGVTGFVGMGNKPTPLRSEEVQGIIKRMEAEAPKVKVTFKPGQKVRIIDGPFNDFHGIVDEIDMDKARARVMVSFFGRDTPVELDFLQVEKI